MELQSFDILFYKGGTSLISKLIKCITKSKYSHVAMYLKDGQVAEIDYKKKFGLYDLGDISEYDVYRINNLTDKQRLKIIKYIQKHLNDKYDYFEILRYLFYRCFRILLSDNKKKIICSEEMFDCLVEAGLLGTKDVEWEEEKVLSPEDLLELLGNELGDNFIKVN